MSQGKWNETDNKLNKSNMIKEKWINTVGKEQNYYFKNEVEHA